MYLFSAISGSYIFLPSFPLEKKEKQKAEQHETLNIDRSIKQRFLLFWNKHIKKGQNSALKKNRRLGGFFHYKTFMVEGLHTTASDFCPAVMLCRHTLVCLSLELEDRRILFTCIPERRKAAVPCNTCTKLYCYRRIVSFILLAQTKYCPVATVTSWWMFIQFCCISRIGEVFLPKTTIGSVYKW